MDNVIQDRLACAADLGQADWWAEGPNFGVLIQGCERQQRGGGVSSKKNQAPLSIFMCLKVFD